MFRKRIVVFKIDTTGLGTDGAMTVVNNIKKSVEKKGISGWFDRLFNDYYFIPSYEGDTTNVMVFR